MHRLMGFWRVQIRAQGAPDRFHLTKPNTFPSTIEKPASLRSDGDRDHPGIPFGFLSEQAFSFAGIYIELALGIDSGRSCVFVGCHLRRKVVEFAVSHETHKPKVGRLRSIPTANLRLIPWFWGTHSGAPIRK